MSTINLVKLTEQWQTKLAEWATSGKTGKAWCQERQLSYSTFRSWKSKLFNTKPNLPQNKSKTKFIELIDEPNKSTDLASKAAELSIEYKQFSIHLTKNFDSSTLKNCLQVLKELI
jgi:hypothetical protein